jgi:hydrophobic/amphiphilic exporter-1 (mainly G- bacteria), HAE1 family
VNLSEPFIRRPVMTVVLTVAVILFGVLSYLQLPVNDLPAVDYPVIEVQAVYPGASPETMANNIATPLERQFMQINGLELVTSKSTQGFTTMTLQFALSKSIDAAATDVQTAITQASGSLPVDMPSPPTFSKTNPNDQPIMYIALTSDSVTSGQLYDYGSTQVGQRISILPGVSRVNVFGTKSAIRIKADPSAMWARGITIDDLAAAVKRGTSYTGAGQLDGAAGTALLRPQGQLETAEAYEDLIVTAKDGAPVYLRDVAEVRDSVQDERINMRFWVRGYPVPSATVVVAVNRQAGSNAVEVAKSIREALPLIGAELPGSVRITPIYDRSQTIVHSVADVQVTLLIAFVLVVIVIFVFLGRVTDTLIPAVALPLSLFITFVAMRLLNYSLDNLSLMALTLAIGFLVDDAIVFLENTVRRMERGEGALAASLNSAKEISFSIVSMTISLAAVFLPLVFMTGLVGRIFREFAVTIVIAILASGLVSLTVTPLMTARLLKERGHGFKQTWMEKIMGGLEKRVLSVYGRSLSWFLERRWVSVVIWVLCLAGTIGLFMIIPKSFLPPGDSSVVFGVFMGREGSSPEQMRAIQDRVDETLHEDPNVLMDFTMTGNGQFLPSNQGITFTFLKPADQREPIDQAAAQMMGKIASNPGVFAFLRPFPVLEISTGAVNTNQGQYAFSLSGVDSDQVYETAGKLMGKLQGYPGFLTLSSDWFSNTPNLDIELRRDQAKMHGVSEARILELLRSAYSQNYLYLIKKPEDQYQVIMEVADAARSQAEDLSLLYIRSDDGSNLVPLRELVTWKTSLGPQAVNHTNQFTSVTLFFNLKPGVAIGDATDFITDAAKEIVPPTVRASLQGEALTFRNTVRDLTLLMLLTVFVMYVILAILYESYVHPLTVLSTLPTALVGGLLTLFLFGEQASLYAFVGMFMLMGIVKKNGILIVDFARQRVDAGEAPEKAIHEASMDRFRPILMTTLAAVVGALPIALGYGADGASRRPLGLVIVGGLVVSQFITLYITPVIYLLLEGFQEKVLNRTAFFRPAPVPVSVRALAPVLLAGLLLTGCTVGPKYQRPPVAAPEQIHGQVGPAEAASLADQAWWEILDDESLKALIDEALRNSYDVRLAGWRVEEARAFAGISRSQRWPQAQAGAGWSRGQAPGGQTDNLYDVNLGVSWEIDLWGRIRRLNEAARAQYLATEEARRGVLLSLVSEVATSYFQLRELDLELEIARRSAAAFQETYDLFNRRLEAGAASGLETASAGATLASTAAEIPDLERLILAQENQLSFLLGRTPGAIPRGNPLDDQLLPPQIPAGLPSDLLQRRPDLRAAEQQLIAANAEVGVAVANFFPRIDLTGAFGGVAPQVSDLFSAGKAWSVGGGILTPIFQGRRLSEEHRAAEARWEQAKVQYEASVTNAFVEVSTTLVAYQKLAEIETEQARAATSYRQAVRLSNDRYLSGLADYLEVLQAQQQQLAAENSLARTRFDRLASLVELYKALGGGWQLSDQEWSAAEAR